MDEKDCRLLLSVSEESSLTRAAERMFMTQPALTYRLQQLEKEFGVPLIDKTLKGAKFTPEGEHLAIYARKMLRDLHLVKEQLSNIRNEVKGTLRLGIANHYSLYKLPPLLKQFQEQYPEVKFAVTCALSVEVIELLARDEIQVGVIRGDHSWYDCKHLLHDEAVCIVSRDPIHLDELPELPQIAFQEPVTKAGGTATTPFREAVASWWYERYDRSPTVAMRVDSYETCKEMVRYGLGYAIIPGIFVTDADGLHQQELIRLDGQGVRRNTWLVYKKSVLQQATAERFIGLMRSDRTQADTGVDNI